MADYISPSPHRPLRRPRRFFSRSPRGPTPPNGSDEHLDGHDPQADSVSIDSPAGVGTPRDHLLSPADYRLTPDSDKSISRSRSFQDLTTSGLAGIFASADDHDIRNTDSPWDTGADQPVKRDPCMDDQLYMLLRDRCYPPARRRVYSISHHPAARQRFLTFAIARLVATRGALLFALGAGYAVLITCFHKEQDPWAITRGYLASWGVLGMILGGLQPGFDALWGPAMAGANRESRDDESKRVEEPTPTPMPDMLHMGTHWRPAMRVVGAVAGLVYAFRHLIWQSTMQVSVALTVVNPVFWWAVDRSRSGFAFSSMVAIVGSLVLLGTDLQLVPSPPVISSCLPDLATDGIDFYLTLGGRVSKEAAEETIWRFSVLFCSSICFGNVGRVLATEEADKTVPWDPLAPVSQ